ncbi:tyrosine-protein phosphatase 10D-like [Ostrinia furnacalis]|uniref:tyrosine-protein phosphatase 10D-like n=1 Tax=Ostrinia furnacalis TaxID=93504 RepID=UPI00103B9904|nr:tyrosine-protein phosphatase 10D-like [Ostrinia furnacalis]
MVVGHKNVEDIREKVSCEIRESPSMMWKGTIVQAKAGCARATAALALGLVVFLGSWRGGAGADLVIEIPGSGLADGAEPPAGRYRLDYRPAQGSPAPNYTVPARASTINFQGLPGTKYHFMLYYSNATFADLLTWNQTIITAPEPPTNLTVTLGRNKQATIAWSPPAHGDYTGFRFKVIPLTERVEGGARNITVEGAGNWTHTLRELSPGATYQLHAFTLLHDKESAAYASRNFTTRPNTPGKFIVWFRNETTLLVLWQPPYPPGAYTHYKVSIVPPDARDSEQYVEKEGEPPGPAQAAFKGLVPGRAYNISVQTVSEPEISAPTTAQYRTVPLRPRNVTVPPAARSETAFRVVWLPPLEERSVSECVSRRALASRSASVGTVPTSRSHRCNSCVARIYSLTATKTQPMKVKFVPGEISNLPSITHLYFVERALKCASPAEPLPVVDVGWRRVEGGEGVRLWWAAAPGSAQDEFRVSYHEAGPSRDDSSSLAAPAANVTLDALLPGRNYTITVAAVSHGVESNESSVSVTTRPLAPVVVSAEPEDTRLRLAWRSDVNSRQDAYRLRWAARPRPRPRPLAAADYRTLETTETNATLEQLTPGAVYEVQVAAVSHGLRSEWHTLLKPVRPLPPASLHVERASSNALRARWEGPAGGALGAFLLQYRAADAAAWQALAPLPATAGSAELAGLAPGEDYVVRLDTLSDAAGDDSVPSGRPLETHHVVRPSPVSNVAQLVDTRNMTLEWPRPQGRVERYELRWWRSDAAPGEDREEGARNVSAAGGQRSARALVDGLRPGRAYTVTIAAHSHRLASDLFTMETRTRPLIQSEMTIVTESDAGEGDEDNTPAVLKVTYTPTPESASQFDSYRFRLDGDAGGGGAGGAGDTRTVERGAGAAPRQVVFAGLVPGRLYNVTMWTVSHNVTSHPVQRQARLFPRPIPWLNATWVSARAVGLAWGAPAGDVRDYELQYLAAPHALRTHHTRAAAYNVTGLRPHTHYTFTVVVSDVSARG